MNLLEGMRCAQWWWLLLVVLPVLLLLWRERRGGAAFPGFAIAVACLRPSRGPALFRWLMAGGLCALALAAARPQFGQSRVERDYIGRDLMLIIDMSGSMQIDDLIGEDGSRSDRLAAVFAAAQQFVLNRPNDRIGLVFFGDTALTSCPLTYDHDTVAQFLERTQRQQRALWAQRQPGLLGSNTNLGLGMGDALRCLRDTTSLGRAMVIITDGADSRDLPTWVDPLLAARHADILGVRVYAIGVGDPNGTMTFQEHGRQLTQPVSPEDLPDMPRLESIVALAHGQAFAANDRRGLTKVFASIDTLEPTPHTVKMRMDYTDRFWIPLCAGILLLGTALVLEPRLRGVA